MKNPVRVLVVDDDESMRSVLKAFLLSEDYSVGLAEDGLKAQEALDREQGAYHLVITDNHMPGLLGVELVRWIKTLYPRTSVIFMTADDRENVLSVARAAGAAECLRKPFAQEQLMLAIKKVLTDPSQC